MESASGAVHEFVPAAADVLWTEAGDPDGRWAAFECRTTGWQPATRLGDAGMAPWGAITPAGFLPGTNQTAPAPLVRTTSRACCTRGATPSA